MAAGLAHEIRNPIASIRGSVQELGDSLDISGDEKRLMNIVLKESDKLNSTITHFLNFARTKEPRLVRCDIKNIISENILLLKRTPRAGDSSIDIDIEGGLICTGDPEQLGQLGARSVNGLLGGFIFTARQWFSPRLQAGRGGIGDHSVGITGTHQATQRRQSIEVVALGGELGGIGLDYLGDFSLRRIDNLAPLVI